MSLRTISECSSMTTRVTFSWENFDNVILAWLPFPQVFQVKIIDNLIGFNLCKRLTLNNHSEIKACNTALQPSIQHFKGAILYFPTWTPSMALAVMEPALLVAVHMYTPWSPGWTLCRLIPRSLTIWTPSGRRSLPWRVQRMTGAGSPPT